MRKTITLLAIVALAAMVLMPAVASAALLTNDYGLKFAGQATCVTCHNTDTSPIEYSSTTHSNFTHVGARPGPTWPIYPPNGPTSNMFTDTDVAFSLGAGTGLYDFLSYDPARTAAQGVIYLNDPVSWDTNSGEWIFEGGTFGPATYGCGQCHQLGVTRPTSGATYTMSNGAVMTASSPNSWARLTTATDAGKPTPADLVAGSSIQCEACHGTGKTGAHWGTGIGIVGAGFNSLGSAASTKILNSEVCGQCHSSAMKATDKNGAGVVLADPAAPNSPLGYTPSENLAAWETLWTEVPTEASFTVNARAYKFYPNGSNKSLKHSYYNEWLNSGHAYRPNAMEYYVDGTNTSHYEAQVGNPSVTPYMQNTGGHFMVTQSNVDQKCVNCHTGEGYMSTKASAARIMTDWAAAFTVTPNGETTRVTDATVGNFGTECATCHEAHSMADGGLAVRQPDTAGVRSAKSVVLDGVTLPAVDNKSICEDCHNWQYQVQGQSPAVKPQASLASRGGPSHPQRETLHGRSMVEVPVAAEFMPEVKCEECHMPKTYAENATGARNYTRYSHRMKVMLPGDAQAWGVETNMNGHDSCRPCHAGETLTQLQESIDAWQTDATNQAAAVATAITTAQTMSEYSLTNAAAPGYILVGKATWNYKTFGSDGSTGVHNPPYIMAGLKKAEQLAKSVGGTFAGFQGSSSLTVGAKGFVAGQVLNGDGTGAAGASINLMKDGVYAGNTTADANGNFSFTIAGDTTHSYQAVWKRSSNALTDKASSAVSVAVAAPTSSTSLYASASTVYRRHSLYLSGAVTPAPGTTWVLIQYRFSTTAAWRDLRWVQTNSSAQFSARFLPATIGYYYYRVVFMGDAGVPGSISRTVRVRVR